MVGLKNSLLKYAAFLGRQNTIALVYAVGLGFSWFLIEIAFIAVIQTFLTAMKIIEPTSPLLGGLINPTIPNATALLVLFTFVRGAVWAIRQYYCVAFSQNFVNEKRSFLLEHSIKNSSSIPNHILLRAFSETTVQSGAFLQNFVLASVVTLTVTLFSAYGFYTAPKEFLTSVVFLALFAIYLRKYDKKLSGLARMIDHERSVLTHVIVDGIRNNFFIKISGRVLDEISRGQKSLSNFDKHFKNYYLITAVRSALPMFLGGSVIAVTFYMSLNFYGTSTSKLLLFFYVLVRLTQSATELANYLTEMQLHFPGFKLLKDIYEKMLVQGPSFINEFACDAKLDASFKSIKSIQAKNLLFSYDSKSTVISNLSFNLNQGDSLLIKGGSGKGKSTLLALIVGLLRPTDGYVKINDQLSSEIFSSVSRRTGYVGPDSYFISGDLKQNLLYGHPNPSTVSDTHIWELLRAVNLSHHIQELPGQLNYQVNNEIPFSTGQKQRLSIARALLRSPDLLLLDESTANLDNETEAEIIQYLASVRSRLIMIIVSHKAGFDTFATHTITL